jgi:hypothetical protein
VAVTGASALVVRAPSLQEAVTAVEVDLMFQGLDPQRLADAVERATEAESLTVTTTRKGRQVVEDLRPSVRRFDLKHDTEEPTVHIEVSTQPRGVRPTDVITALRGLASDEHEPDISADRVLRTHQWIERDGARLEPLEADRAAARAAVSVRVMNKGLTNARREDTGGDERPHREAASGDRRIA